MKCKMMILSLVALAGLGMTWALENDGADVDNAGEKGKPAKTQQVDTSKMKPVAKALAGVETVNAKPNYKAKYYIYLQSASWCPPCREEMPKVAKAYPEMKKKKVEIILIGGDETLEGVGKFLSSNKAEFPGVNIRDKAARALPGYKPSPSWPHVIFVDDKGNMLHEGHGADTLKWEEIIKKKAQKKGKK